MRPADKDERRHLNETFAALCAIPSPFGSERASMDAVRRELYSLGIETEEDGAANDAGAQCGNVLARIPGRSERNILLCTHVDTVAVADAIEPVVVDGEWRNAREAILGADNKAAVAVVLELARRCAGERPPLGLELLFTVAEENALAGSKAFDAGRLRSDYGYVFDHASPIGEIVIASPTAYRVDAELRGVAVHAGIRPEAGRSAIVAAAVAIYGMRLGRLDPETTANVGSIHGGAPTTNIVPDRCAVAAEARSLDAERVDALVAEMIDRLHDGANAAECDLDVEVTQTFRGYRHRRSAPQVLAAEAALRTCGIEPSHIVTGGASDANALESAGFACTNLANGTERNHQPDESVPVAALEQMLDVSLALLDAAAAC
ncbi:MAG: M20/M25/M40 family metallo-hydrolase [Solirubrobacteraceae bacterium]